MSHYTTSARNSAGPRVTTGRLNSSYRSLCLAFGCLNAAHKKQSLYRGAGVWCLEHAVLANRRAKEIRERWTPVEINREIATAGWEAPE